MHTIQTTVYTFAELKALGNQKATQKALEWGYGIAADYEWWEYNYLDAETIGCKISGFDLGRAQSIDFKLIDSALEVAYKILENHGETCDTYQLAKHFIAERVALVEKFSDGVKLDTVTEENESVFDEKCDELETEFEKDLGRLYWEILKNAFEYLTSEEAIIENFEANEYTFDESGKRFG